MRAAIYARYSSENQRPESIADQISACRRLATERAFTVLDNHVYSDEAKSGARRDRLGLSALVADSQEDQFDVVLVDDLSRLARDNYLMLSVIAELHFRGRARRVRGRRPRQRGRGGHARNPDPRHLQRAPAPRPAEEDAPWPDRAKGAWLLGG